MQLRQARAEIERSFPGLSIREMRFLGAGVDSEAYLINGEWVFRFPKRAAAARGLSREAALLPKLAGRLPVAIPQFQYIGTQSRNGLPFAGYRYIPGEPLTAELFVALPHADQERILATLATFLEAVHGFPVAEAVAAGVDPFSTRDWVDASWSSGRDRVLPRLSIEAAAATAQLITRFLGDERNFAYTPCLLYADFGVEHVIYDPAGRNIIGIIDWGDLTIGDPDFDLMYLRQDYGEGFIRRLLAHYPHPDPARLLAKLRVFDVCDQVTTIVDALDGGAEGAVIDESLAALAELRAPERST